MATFKVPFIFGNKGLDPYFIANATIEYMVVASHVFGGPPPMPNVLMILIGSN